MKKLKIISMVLIVALLLCSCGNTEVKIKRNWEDEYKNEFVFVDAKTLYDNQDDYNGKKIMTVVNISDTTNDSIKADVNKNDLWFDFVFYFDDSSEINGVEDDKQACIIGDVDTSYQIGNTMSLHGCHLVAYDDVSKYNNYSTHSSSKKKKKNNKNSASSYKKGCKEYSYKKIMRSPNKYKDKKTRVLGKVIQVEEGWFDGVTLLIKDYDNNIWYVTYTYSDNENKILEDDTILVYGECQGTKQYETIVGKSEIVPYIDAKYID